MHPLWTSVVAAARLRYGGGTRGGSGMAVGRLLWGEVVWATRQALDPTKMAVAGLVAVGVGVALGPTTPGPVLDGGWRMAVATLLGLVGLAVAHAMLKRRKAPVPSRGSRAGRPEGDGLAPEDAVDRLRVIVGAVAVLLAGTIVLSYLLALITGTPAGQETQPLSASLQIDAPLLGSAALLAAAVLVAGLTRRVAVPASLLLLGLGMVIGSDGLALVELSDPELVQSLGVIALVVILFDGGLTTEREQLRLGVGPGLALATLGVAVTAGITAGGTMWLLDIPPRIAWLIGAVVASTDATAVFALLRRTPVADRLAAVLQIESGANDPVAVLLTVGLLSAWDAPTNASAWVAFGALQLIGGVAVGTAAGWLGAMLLRRVNLGTVGLYPVLALAVAGLAYGSAVVVGASGFLSTYLAGIVVAAEAPRRRGSIRTFFASVSGGVEVGLFLMLGLLVFPRGLADVAAVAIGVTLLLTLVARPVGVALSLAWFDLPPREVGAVAWLGMRGAVPIVLATLAFSAGVPEAPLVFDIVFFVVVTSALLQGTTAAPLVRYLGLRRPESQARTVVEALPLETVDVDVIEVALDEGSLLVGRQLVDVAPPEDVLIAAVVRSGRVIVPRGFTRLQAGDRLVITTTDRAGVTAIEEWVGSGHRTA